ncbi:hypothetical protein B0H14DRAFT_2755087, partial [Mycena olivaceomarginata]
SPRSRSRWCGCSPRARPPAPAPPAPASPAVITATAAAILWSGREERFDGRLLLLKLRLRHGHETPGKIRNHRRARWECAQHWRRHVRRDKAPLREAGRRQVRRNEGNIGLWRNQKHTLRWNGSHIFSQLIHSSDYSSQFSLTVVYITLQPFVQSSHVSHQLSLLVDSSELSQNKKTPHPENLHQRVGYWCRFTFI